MLLLAHVTVFFLRLLTDARDARILIMKPAGFIQLVIFFGAWTVSPVYSFTALVLFIFSKLYYPLLPIVAYYTFRFVSPAKYWPYFQDITHHITSKHPYFDKQEVVFEDDEEIKENSKTMLCFHPHGYVRLGYFVLST